MDLTEKVGELTSVKGLRLSEKQKSLVFEAVSEEAGVNVDFIFGEGKAPAVGRARCVCVALFRKHMWGCSFQEIATWMNRSHTATPITQLKRFLKKREPREINLFERAEQRLVDLVDEINREI